MIIALCQTSCFPSHRLDLHKAMVRLHAGSVSSIKAGKKMPINFHSHDGTVRRTRHHSRPPLNHQGHQSSQPRPLLQPPALCGMTQWNTASTYDCSSRKSASFWAAGQWSWPEWLRNFQNMLWNRCFYSFFDFSQPRPPVRPAKVSGRTMVPTGVVPEI